MRGNGKVLIRFFSAVTQNMKAILLRCSEFTTESVLARVARGNSFHLRKIELGPRFRRGFSDWRK